MKCRCPKCTGRSGDKRQNLEQIQEALTSENMWQAESLYQAFNGFEPSCVVKVRHARMMPPVVVELGELVGVIYRSDKGLRGRRLTYIHRMEDPPRLVSNIEGTQLYIVGGSYRVTSQGIEG